MPKSKRVIVIEESDTGRNKKFQDQGTGEIMNRSQFVRKIKGGIYSDEYYVRDINGLPTPVSKPDGKKGNNLG